MSAQMKPLTSIAAAKLMRKRSVIGPSMQTVSLNVAPSRAKSSVSGAAVAAEAAPGAAVECATKSYARSEEGAVVAVMMVMVTADVTDDSARDYDENGHSYISFHFRGDAEDHSLPSIACQRGDEPCNAKHFSPVVGQRGRVELVQLEERRQKPLQSHRRES